MLKKLLKYEFKATSRTYGGLYLVWLLLGLLLGISMRNMVETENPNGWQIWMVLMLLYVGITIAAGVVCIMTIIQRFTKNLLEREGYLMHTLPVNEYQLVGSKLISSLVWVVCSAGVGLLSIVLLMLGLCAFQSPQRILASGTIDGVPYERVVTYTWGDLWGILRQQLAQLGGSFWASTAWSLFVGLLGTAVLILCIYAACMVGHLFRKHTTAASIVAFFLFQSVQSKLGGTAGVSSLIRITIRSANVLPESTSAAYPWVNLLIMVLFGAAYFVTASWLMKNKLDLE